MRVSSGSGDSDLLGPSRPPLPRRAHQQEQAGEGVSGPSRGLCFPGPSGTQRPGRAGPDRAEVGGSGAGLPKCPPSDAAVEPLVQPRGRPSGPRPAAPASVSPRAPRLSGGRCRPSPPRGGSLALRPLGAPSPLTSDEDSLREGHCAAGGGGRGPGPAPPAPAARRRPAAAPPAAAPSGRGAHGAARGTRGCPPRRERAPRPLLPTVTASRRTGPRRIPAV